MYDNKAGSKKISPNATHKLWVFFMKSCWWETTLHKSIKLQYIFRHAIFRGDTIKRALFGVMHSTNKLYLTRTHRWWCMTEAISSFISVGVAWFMFMYTCCVCVCLWTMLMQSDRVNKYTKDQTTHKND